MKENDLKQLFKDYGTVVKVVIPTDRATGKIMGHAFVEMSN